MNHPLRVLIVDDDVDLLKLIEIRLRRAGIAVETARTAGAALRTLERLQPDVVVTDLRMEAMDGIELLSEIERRYPVLPVILLTAHGTIPDAVVATKKGAFAFLTKPFEDEELIGTIRDAALLRGTDQPSQSSDWRSEMLTRSPAMEAVLQEARLAAASDASVLIQSGSGTGKELLGRAIHAASARAGESFVAVNCTAIPEPLFESELFGHVKGAFTGADRDRMGLLQRAHKGTLFFDEIGDMPVGFQAKLLRVLQERTVRPVGSDDHVAIDVRIVSATNRNLEEAVAREEFREDLYYRLGVVVLELPALAERREDIPLLADHFLHQFDGDGIATAFSSEAMERLIGAPWPGNVRQLANVVQQCKVLSRTPLIPASLVDHALRTKAQGLIPFADARDRFEVEYLTSLLQTTEGNVSQAARLARRNRSEFYKLLSKHGLDPSEFRAGGGTGTSRT